MYVLTAILFIVLDLGGGIFFSPFSSLIFFSCEFMAIFNVMFGFLFLCFLVYLLDFCFIITMRFLYSSLL